MDTHNLFTASLEAVFVEFLHVYVFALFVIDMLGLVETFSLESNAFFLKDLHL